MNITLCITTIPESVPPTIQSQSNLNAVNYFREGEFFEIELGQVESALNYRVSMKINGDEVNCFTLNQFCPVYLTNSDDIYRLSGFVIDSDLI